MSQPLESSCRVTNEWRMKSIKKMAATVAAPVNREHDQGLRLCRCRRPRASNIFPPAKSGDTTSCLLVDACILVGEVHVLAAEGAGSKTFSAFRRSRVSECRFKSYLAVVKVVFFSSWLSFAASGEFPSLSSSAEEDNFLRIGGRSTRHSSMGMSPSCNRNEMHGLRFNYGWLRRAEAGSGRKSGNQNGKWGPKPDTFKTSQNFSSLITFIVIVACFFNDGTKIDIQQITRSRDDWSLGYHEESTSRTTSDLDVRVYF